MSWWIVFCLLKKIWQGNRVSMAGFLSIIMIKVMVVSSSAMLGYEAGTIFCRIAMCSLS